MKDDNRSLAFGLLTVLVGAMVAAAYGSKCRGKRTTPGARGWPHPLVLFVSGGLVIKAGDPPFKPKDHRIQEGETLKTTTTTATIKTCHDESTLTLGHNSTMIADLIKDDDGTKYIDLDLTEGTVTYIGLVSPVRLIGVGAGRKFLAKSRGFAVGASATAYSITTLPDDKAQITVTEGKVLVAAVADLSKSVEVVGGKHLIVEKGKPVDHNSPVDT